METVGDRPHRYADISHYDEINGESLLIGIQEWDGFEVIAGTHCTDNKTTTDVDINGKILIFREWKMTPAEKSFALKMVRCLLENISVHSWGTDIDRLFKERHKNK